MVIQALKNIDQKWEGGYHITLKKGYIAAVLKHLGEELVKDGSAKMLAATDENESRLAGTYNPKHQPSDPDPKPEEKKEK